MKHFTLTILLIIVAMTLSCVDNDTKQTITGNKTALEKNSKSTLRMMGHWYGEGKKELLVRELVREFTLLNQDIELNLEFPNQIFSTVPEAELYFAECDSIQGMIEQNKWPYDILFCDQERYKKVGQLINNLEWGKTYLVDFSEEQWFKNAHKSGLIDAMNLKSRYGGIMPGPVIEGITNIMFVSEYVEKLLGIKVKDLDMGFSDFISYSQAVESYNKSHTDKITFFSTQYNTATSNVFTQFITSAFGKTVAGSKEEGLKAVEEAYIAFEKLSKYNALEQHISSTGLTYDVAQRILHYDKCLFTIQPTWMILLWHKSNPNGLAQMRPCEIPSLDNKTSPYYPGFSQLIFVVPKNCQNPEAAKRFIEFISTTETADKWVKYSKCPTGMKTTLSYNDFGQDIYEIFFRHIQKKYGNNQFDVNVANLLFNKNITLDFKVDDVLNGKISSKEAMKNVEKQIR